MYRYEKDKAKAKAQYSGAYFSTLANTSNCMKMIHYVSGHPSQHQLQYQSRDLQSLQNGAYHDIIMPTMVAHSFTEIGHGTSHGVMMTMMMVMVMMMVKTTSFPAWSLTVL
ncbi:hypothetical protein DUNSADRAFT_445 [Dunaliella salina]|uniref:Encoded protein n=1 Tax=Dunaliella salina TaxID=3046 RepID=A0ABQ7GY88_DUNSA|nr:hypothetical protein DUNSADRAFT_445 [Dunaliella salina]|eukprot:KAF5839570.1 hypothetical protein DUNSADRAFT_445 [Dunaliella salina]